jgi:hypothetical protein
MALLIDKTNIQEYKPISKNINDSRINTFIQEAQLFDLRPFLGSALYKDFIDNVADANYQTLLNGGPYTIDGETIDFIGVKAMLVYFSYSRIMYGQSINVTRYGITKKETDQSSEQKKENKESQAVAARSAAIGFQEETTLFLNENADTYPLWDQNKTSKNKNISGFDFGKAQTV